jgi:predicted ribosome quality control (RQC) complex YloA/Tae2 family protein
LRLGSDLQFSRRCVVCAGQLQNTGRASSPQIRGIVVIIKVHASIHEGITTGDAAGAACQEQAAILAATHSKAADSVQVPVDYAQARYVKKPSGAKPGMVIYTDNRTAYVNPDPALCARLKVE